MKFPSKEQVLVLSIAKMGQAVWWRNTNGQFNLLHHGRLGLCPYGGHFQLHVQFQPLDQIENYLI